MYLHVCIMHSCTFRLQIIKSWAFYEAIESVKKRWIENGFSMVDFIVTGLLIWAHIITTFIFLICLQKSSKSISKLCTAMAALNKSLEIDEHKLKYVKRRTYLAMIFLFILHVLSILSAIDYSRKLLIEKVLNIPLYVIWFIILFLFYWPLPTAVSFLMTRLCLFGLILQMETFESKAPKGKF